MKLPATGRVALSLLLAGFASCLVSASETARAPAGAPQEGAQQAAEPRTQVTAVGDIHGDHETFCSLLRKAGLLGADGSWSGGTRHLVQTGDFLDRGAGSRRVMDLLRQLEREARTAGGKVTVVLGNHEAMNLCGDLVSTTTEEIAVYADLEDPAEREARKTRILGLLASGSPLLRSNYLKQLGRVLDARTFEQFFPRGFFGHRKALRPTGPYGRWLLEHDFVHREAGALFLHGGLSNMAGFRSVEDLNRGVRDGLTLYFRGLEELETLGVFDEALGFRELLWLIDAERRVGPVDPKLVEPFRRIDDAWNSLAFHTEGPLWFRGLAQLNERTIAPLVEELCRFHGVERIVIGHTQPASLRVELRCSNRIVLIDTGLNQRVYRGTPSAVLIEPGRELRVWE